jgi:hypothetical protein
MAQFELKSPEIVAAVQAGATIEEGSRASEVPVASVRRWLRDGRKGREPYATFSAAVDGARGERRDAERALTDGPLSREEAELLLAKAARKGSVPALRLWFEQRAVDDASQRGDGARELLAAVFGDDDGR